MAVQVADRTNRLGRVRLLILVVSKSLDILNHLLFIPSTCLAPLFGASEGYLDSYPDKLLKTGLADPRSELYHEDRTRSGINIAEA